MGRSGLRLAVLLVLGLVCGAGSADAVVRGGNGRIAFGLNPNVYVVDEDGTGLAPLTLNPPGSFDTTPAWSPDGTTVALSNNGYVSPPGYSIQLVDAQGTNRRLVTHPSTISSSDPAWSPAGDKIAFNLHSGDSDAIGIVNPDGTGLTILTGYRQGGPHSPAWSPDGTKIAFWENGDIWTIAPNGTGLTNLTNSPAFDLHPDWSPDGSRIVFSSNRLNPGGNAQIHVMNADGSNLVRLSFSTDGELYPTWSPDGTKIAFSSSFDGNSQLNLMNADGSGQHVLVDSATNDDYPSWEAVPGASVPPLGAGAALPATIVQGGLTKLTVKVSPGQNPTSTGMTVVADLTPVGGSATQAFYDDGTHGDAAGGDGVFTFDATVAPATSPGTKTLVVQVGDAQARTSPTVIGLDVIQDLAPTVAGTNPPNGMTGTPANANPWITFSEPVTVSGTWYGITCSVSGAHQASYSGGPTTYYLHPLVPFMSGETCTVTIFAAGVADQDGVATPMAGDYSFSFQTGAPTAVEIARLTARRSGTDVVVRWRSGSEGRVVGFHVYRDRAGRRVRLTQNLIVARGSGRSYVWRDRLPGARPLRYWLQLVRPDGTRSFVGPVRAR